MKSVCPEKASAAVGPYNQTIETNGFVLAPGQLPIDPSTGKFPEGGIKEQARQSILNTQEVLEAAGLDLSRVIETTVYLPDMASFGTMNEMYAQFLTEPYPARSAVAVRILPREALVEVKRAVVKG